MENGENIIRTIITVVCLGGLICMAAAAIVCTIVSTMRQAQRRIRKSKRVNTAAALFFAAVAVIYGGSKTGPRFSFDGLIPIPGASVATNDLVHVEWSYNPDFMGIENDYVYIAYRDCASTNDEDWVRWPQSWRIADRGAEFELANATSYNYFVWTEYIPPSPVVTNGVYHLNGFARTETESDKIVSLRVQIRVETNGGFKVIAPLRENDAKMDTQTENLNEEIGNE